MTTSHSSRRKEALPLEGEALDAWRILAIFNGLAVGDRKLERPQHRRNALGWEIYHEEIAALQEAGVISPDLDSGLEGFGMASLIEGIAAQMIMAPGHRASEDLVKVVERHIEQVFGKTRARPRRAKLGSRA